MAIPPQYDYLFKILLVGEPGIGKSCLLIRFTDDLFSETYVSTIGVDFKIKNVEVKGKTIKLQMWDTAGQERFRTITSSYYRGAHGVILCFDLANRTSFEKLEDWMKEIAKYAAKNVRVVLCALKLDLDLLRAVTHDEAMAFAQRHKIKFVEASPKNKTGVEDAFYALAEDVLDLHLENPKTEQQTTSTTIDPTLPDTDEHKCQC